MHMNVASTDQTVRYPNWNDYCTLLILCAASLPLISVFSLALFSDQATPTAGKFLLNVAGTAAPFVTLGAYRYLARAGDSVCRICVPAGLTAAVIGWLWVTLDVVLFGGFGSDAMNIPVWMTPTIALAMVASYGLDKAVSI